MPSVTQLGVTGHTSAPSSTVTSDITPKSKTSSSERPGALLLVRRRDRLSVQRTEYKGLEGDDGCGVLHGEPKSACRPAPMVTRWMEVG